MQQQIRQYKARYGHDITEECDVLARRANEDDEPYEMDFNDIKIVAQPGCVTTDLVLYYRDESERRHLAWIASPEYAERERAAEEIAAKRRAELADALSRSPAEPTMRDSEKWATFAEKNSDGYGGAVVKFAALWARLMEGAAQSGETVVQCADRLSRLANADLGITGFQYGCAVSALAETWIRGEELRRWHNRDVQVGDEGDRANEEGGVLNPALLQIG